MATSSGALARAAWPRMRVWIKHVPRRRVWRWWIGDPLVYRVQVDGHRAANATARFFRREDAEWFIARLVATDEFVAVTR